MRLSLYLLIAIAVALAIAVAWSRYDSRPLPLDLLRKKYTLPGSSFVTLAGVDTHVIDEGDGQPVVLLHGNANSAWLWNDWAALLVGAGYRVIRFDLPSHGLSGPIPQGQPGIVSAFEILGELIDYKGISKAVLIGTANGGPPAAWYARTHPDRVSAMVLINTPFYAAEGSTNTLAGQRWARANLYPLIGKPWPADWLYVKELAGRKQAIEPTLVSHIHDISRRTDIPNSSFLAVYGSSFEFSSATWNPSQQSNRDMLSELTLPAMVIWGGRSLLPMSEAQRLARHLRQAQVTVKTYPDGGHWLPLYQPAATVSDLLQFLSAI